MENKLNPEWLKAALWVKIYSWITFSVVLYGIIVTHIPYLFGHPWTLCDGCRNQLWCNIIFHLYEVPLLLFNAYVAWYGLKTYSPKVVHSYMSLLSFAVTTNLVFLTFETVLLNTNLHANAADWENFLSTTVALILVAGSFLGMYVKQLIVKAVYQKNNDED
ncbi:MAG: hypothetical protein RDU14_07495 [Melioribacteraceae bacterium]|nr:hypothetical protein [Melioribacteraceae bacterium]